MLPPFLCASFRYRNTWCDPVLSATHDLGTTRRAVVACHQSLPSFVANEGFLMPCFTLAVSEHANNVPDVDTVPDTPPRFARHGLHVWRAATRTPAVRRSRHQRRGSSFPFDDIPTFSSETPWQLHVSFPCPLPSRRILVHLYFNNMPRSLTVVCIRSDMPHPHHPAILRENIVFPENYVLPWQLLYLSIEWCVFFVQLLASRG